jgi:hypothetical protein
MGANDLAADARLGARAARGPKQRRTTPLSASRAT